VDFSSIIIGLIILIFSAVFHEVCHGVVADKLGDSTARFSGRLTFNPIPHIDLYGSVLLPLFMLWATSGAFFFATAKPVPVNFLNLRNPKRDMILVSLAGPLANFFLAIAFAIPVRLGLLGESNAVFELFVTVVYINLILGIFNLLPIPPLDGSKVLAGLGPDRFMYTILSWERFGFILIILFLVTGLLSSVLTPLLRFSSGLILGFPVI